jgi:hypothetical protein
VISVDFLLVFDGVDLWKDHALDGVLDHLEEPRVVCHSGPLGDTGAM